MFVREPSQSEWVSLRCRGRPGLKASDLSKPVVCFWHRLERRIGLLWKPCSQARIKPRDCQIPLIATLVTRQRVDGHSNQSTAASHGVKKNLVRRPDLCEAALFDGDPFLRTHITHEGNAQGCCREVVWLDLWSLRVGLQEWHPGAEPGGNDSFGMQQGHAASPVTTTTMAPECPRDRRQLGVV